ncbi:MAG: hypothetical protein JO184_14090, partial [Gammaproteobacteria bacterium]|nr:hypothetical protein [Gammaproteobacteria bacterium]
MPVMRIQGRASSRQRRPNAAPYGVRRALTCLLSGFVPLIAAAQSAAPTSDGAAAQGTQTGAPASDLQQRLQRLEQSQQALQNQLQENAAEIEA